MLRNIFIPAFFLLFASTNLLADPQSPWKWSASYLMGVRNGYVFPGSNTEKASQIGLLSGKGFAGAGRSTNLRPWGVELEGSYRVSDLGGPFLNLRIVPFSLQLPGGPEQTGVDWFTTVGYQVFVLSKEDSQIGFRVSFRARRWRLKMASYRIAATRVWESRPLSTQIHGFFSAEVGLTAFNFGTPNSLGLQRDSSTLRLRGGYRMQYDSFSFVPALEFFHTHRDLYASRLIAGESTLFIDEVSLALVLSVGLVKAKKSSAAQSRIEAPRWALVRQDSGKSNVTTLSRRITLRPSRQKALNQISAARIF